MSVAQKAVTHLGRSSLCDCTDEKLRGLYTAEGVGPVYAAMIWRVAQEAKRFFNPVVKFV